MARGWESKSVEAQIDMAGATRRSANFERSPDPETLLLIRRRENLELSRTRVVRELTSVQNPRYRALLTKALSDLDAQLNSLGAV